MKLYSYWRSQASYRVRIALHLKDIQAEIVTLDLLKGDQHAPAYRAVNPEGVVPALILDGRVPLFQSLAIVEYLDEQYPEPRLLPADARDRAYVRALAQIVAMDAHPFIVPRVRKYLEHELGLDEPARTKWLSHWLDAGTRTLEHLLARDARTGLFCHRDALTLVDICLAAHVTSAIMLCGFDIGPYPAVRRVFDRCMELDAFTATHPLRQPDAPRND